MSETITCTECRATLPGGATFCTSCGHRTAGADPSPAAPPAPSAGEDATRVDNPGLQDATQTFAAPAPQGEPWQPAGGSASPPPGGPATSAPWNTPATPPWQQQAPPMAPPPAAQPWGAPGPGGYQAPATTSATTHKSPLGAAVAALGGLLVLVGLFTAWIGSNQGDETISGWDMVSGDKGFESTDPYLILVLGIAALAVAAVLFLGISRPIMRIAVLVVGLAVVGVAVRDWLSIADVAKGFSSEVEITAQFGFYLTIAGGVVTAIAAILPASKTSA